MEKMKAYYNGYSFGDVAETLYNPFGLLNFFSKKKRTETPGFPP